ncbi:MAG: YckD family protein [Peptococcaceae bacterium]|nr:YckD family protein [Peptococcaceae bacterium]
MRKRLLAGAVVMAVILVMAGVAFAGSATQPGQDGPALFGNFIAKFAANLGVDQDKVTAALEATKKQMLEEAVQQGRITQEQADRMAANGGPWFGGFGKNFDRKPGFKGRGFNEDMAKALGLTQEQLKSEFDSGKRLPQIIEERGLTLEQFHQKMLEIKKESLSKAVSEGKLTQEQADKIIKKMEERQKMNLPKE